MDFDDFLKNAIGFCLDSSPRDLIDAPLDLI